MYTADLGALCAQLGVAGLLSSRKPANQVTRSGARVRGVPATRFTTQLTRASSYERRFIRVADLSRSVVTMITQPFVLRIEGLGKRSEYTPDAALLVQPPGGQPSRRVIAECKPLEEAKTDECLQAHELIGATLRRIDIHFVVVTEREQPPSLDANLDRVLRQRLFWRGETARNELERRVRHSGFDTFSALKEAVGVIDALHALASGWLHFDHFSPLIGDTRLSEKQRADWDAARALYEPPLPEAAAIGSRLAAFIPTGYGALT